MEDKIEKLIKEIKQTQDALKLHALQREAFKQEIDSLKQNIEFLKDEIDALLALQSLGYSQNEARSALKEIPQNLDTNKKIKEALKVLGGK